MPHTLSPEQSLHLIDAGYAAMLLAHKTFEAIKDAAQDGDIESIKHLVEGPLVAIPPVAMDIADRLTDANVDPASLPLCNAVFEMVDGL